MLDFFSTLVPLLYHPASKAHSLPSASCRMVFLQCNFTLSLFRLATFHGFPQHIECYPNSLPNLQDLAPADILRHTSGLSLLHWFLAPSLCSFTYQALLNLACCPYYSLYKVPFPSALCMLSDSFSGFYLSFQRSSLTTTTKIESPSPLLHVTISHQLFFPLNFFFYCCLLILFPTRLKAAWGLVPSSFSLPL